jgi:hypothetical protein
MHPGILVWEKFPDPAEMGKSNKIGRSLGPNPRAAKIPVVGLWNKFHTLSAAATK